MKYLKLFDSVEEVQYKSIEFEEMLVFVNDHLQIKFPEVEKKLIKSKFRIPVEEVNLRLMKGERRRGERDALTLQVEKGNKTIYFKAYDDYWYLMTITSDNPYTFVDFYFKCDEIDGLISAIDYCKKKKII